MGFIEDQASDIKVIKNPINDVRLNSSGQNPALKTLREGVN